MGQNSMNSQQSIIHHAISLFSLPNPLSALTRTLPTLLSPLGPTNLHHFRCYSPLCCHSALQAPTIQSTKPFRRLKSPVTDLFFLSLAVSFLVIRLTNLNKWRGSGEGKGMLEYQMHNPRPRFFLIITFFENPNPNPSC